MSLNKYIIKRGVYMLKGKTTIQLFNALTGFKEYERTEKNIVTNAVANALNLPLESRLSNQDDWAFSVINNNLPLYKNAYGGLLMFGDTHTEDVNNCLPSTENTLVGMAGTDLSGINEKQGDYNIAESGAIENGFRFVWDFATDRANGTIKSVSLTSVAGGNTGGGEVENSPIVCTSSLSVAEAENRKFLNGLNDLEEHLNITSLNGAVCYISNVEDGRFFIICYDATANKIYKVFYNDISNRRITLDSLNDFYSREVIVDGVFENNFGLWSCWVNNNKINVIDAQSNETLATHKIFALDGTLENTISVTCPFGISPKSVGHYNGQYICAANSDLKHIARFSPTGVIISEINLSTAPSRYVGFSINQHSGDGVLLAYKRDTSYTYYIQGLRFSNEGNKKLNDIIKGGSNSGHPQFACLVWSDFEKVKAPHCLISTQEAGTRLSTYLESDYLATINNLEEPITKSSAQTLKIIYELTEEE